ncbi:MAG: AAA family ATPase [Isosphaerales bacterium]
MTSFSGMDAYVFAKLLAGVEVNGELAAMSEGLRPLATLLGTMKAHERLCGWQAALASRPDHQAVRQAVLDADPLGPAPAPVFRRSAHLGDLTSCQSAGRFIWPSWIVRGHFTLLSSDPKIGKTHLALDLARRLWFGLSWPDGQPSTFPAGTTTLWVCGDRHQDELRERAAAFGLPAEAVRLNALPGEPYGGWDLDNPDNVKLLNDLVASEHPGLVFIDTVWRATRRRLNKEDEVNALMTPIVSIAQSCDVSIMGLMHLSKDQDTLGRRLEGLARGIMKMFKPDPAQPDRRRLEVIGNFKEPPALGVTLRDGGCDFDFEPPKEAARPPGGRPPEKTDKAIAFLIEKLSGGDQKGCELIGEWLARGESKSPIFEARRVMQADGRLVIDDSKKPQIWHMVKSESRTVQNPDSDHSRLCPD